MELAKRKLEIHTALPENFKARLNLVRLLVQRDLRVRYRGSFFGYLWSMMNPMLHMIILTFVFKHLVRFKIENYSMFILSGILCWNLFQQSMATGVHSIVANGALLRKVKVPAALFPVANICSVLVNFALALIPYFVIGLFLGVHFSFSLLLLPFAILPYFVFILGCVLFVSSLNTFFRDVGHVTEPLLTILFYASPVIYDGAHLPEKYQALAQLNPLFHFLKVVRTLMFEGGIPELREMAILYGLAAVFFLIGILVYKKLRHQFVLRL